MIPRAIDLANRAHAGQRRKYNNLPYIVHPASVATAALKRGMAEHEIAAAWLHDVIEDSPAFVGEMETAFRNQFNVVLLVRELTNASLGSALPRKERKQMDREKLQGASKAAQTLKLLDRLDNVGDMLIALDACNLSQKEIKFLQLYGEETTELANALTNVNAYLLTEVGHRLVRKAGEKLA